MTVESPVSQLTRGARIIWVLALVVSYGAHSASAFAHAHISPSVVEAGHSESFTVVVPTEGDARTTKVEVLVPDGFQVGAFEATPGWKRKVDAAGSGDEAIVSRVAWTGGRVAEGEAAYLRFVGEARRTGSFAFKVRQTYSDGTVSDWKGGIASEEPAPVVFAVDDFEGGGNGPLTVVALVLAALALLAAVLAVGVGRGRPLT